MTLCARSGNTDFCCDGGRTPCGLDCCDDFLQCCDGECCADGAVCLTQVFDEGPFVEEETCCLAGQTCDNRCCAGDCFTPLGTLLVGFERECCAAEEGLTFCPGRNDFADFGLCCSGDTPGCCHNSLGQPVCITSQQCCSDRDCVESGYHPDCITCNIDTNKCDGKNVGGSCAGSECGTCQFSLCLPEEDACGTCETCNDQLTCGSLCDDDQTCCLGRCFDGVGLTCCLTNDDCPNGCSECTKPQGPGPGICEFACEVACCPLGQPEEYFCVDESDSCCASCSFDEKCCYGACINVLDTCCANDDECVNPDPKANCEVAVCRFHACQLDPLDDNADCLNADGICCGGLCSPSDAICCTTNDDCGSLDVPDRCVAGFLRHGRTHLRRPLPLRARGRTARPLLPEPRWKLFLRIRS